MCFIVRTDDELSVISPEFMAPKNVQQLCGYRCVRLAPGTPPETVGVIDSLVHPAAEAAISLFTISSFTTTYLFVLHEQLEAFTQILQRAGHTFVPMPEPAPVAPSSSVIS
jgi:hypothetical protein